MKRLIVKGITVALLVAALAFPLASPAFADQSPNGPGQPGALPPDQGGGTTCTSTVNNITLNPPTGAAAAPGSVFNPSGTAGTVYAGNPGTASAANSNSDEAVSQYDIACFQVSQPHP